MDRLMIDLNSPIPETADEWYLRQALEATREQLLDTMRENERLRQALDVANVTIQGYELITRDLPNKDTDAATNAEMDKLRKNFERLGLNKGPLENLESAWSDFKEQDPSKTSDNP